MRGLLISAVALVVVACSSPATHQSAPTVTRTQATTTSSWDGGWGTSAAPTSISLPPASTSSPGGDGTAAAAKQYILDNLGATDFQSYSCGTADVGTPHCWAPYVSDITYSSGVLRVALQVNRASSDGKAMGANAARAVANFIRLGSPPASLSDVDWVEVTDGASTHIAQEAVR
jgi:hypothetical protein